MSTAPQTSAAAQSALGPDGKVYPACAICAGAVLYPNPALDQGDDEDVEDDEEEEAGDDDEDDRGDVPRFLLDDVTLDGCPNAHHFHWECITTHRGDADWCPACVQTALPPRPGSSAYGYVASDIGQVLSTVTTTEGGTETAYDIKPAILEEQTRDSEYLLNRVRPYVEQLLDPEAGASASSAHNANVPTIAAATAPNLDVSIGLVLAQFSARTLVQALFECCQLGDASGILELVALMPSEHEIRDFVNQPLDANIIEEASSSSSSGGSTTSSGRRRSTGSANPSGSASSSNSSVTRERAALAGWTPLFEATLCGRAYIVRMLLELGADPRVSARDTATGVSKTLLDYAHATNREDIAALLQRF